MTNWIVNSFYTWAIDGDSGKLYDIFCNSCGFDKFTEPVRINDPKGAHYCTFCDTVLCLKCFKEHPMFCGGLERH